MANKPITRGIKLYMGVDYDTKFAFDFNVCDGSITAENSTAFPYGATGRQIVKLLEGLVGMGYKVYVDNYYTSIPVATELLSRHIYLIGTLRKDRGVPSSVVVGTSKSRSNAHFRVTKSTDPYQRSEHCSQRVQEVVL
jgi:hypothetical protein